MSNARLTPDSLFHSMMKETLVVAEQALPHDVPVGASLYLGNEFICASHNRREKDQNPVGHAEILVLEEAGRRLGRWRLEDTTLVVTLEPCPMCASAILQARVSRIVFGAYDPVMGMMGSQPMPKSSPFPEVIGGVMEAECRSLLLSFFRSSRGTKPEGTGLEDTGLEEMMDEFRND